MSIQTVRTIISCEGVSKQGNAITFELTAVMPLATPPLPMESSMEEVAKAARNTADDLGVDARSFRITQIQSKIVEEPPKTEGAPKV